MTQAPEVPALPAAPAGPVPAPPPGPGVVPPFPAPPTEGRGRRVGLGLGLGALVLLLACGGGLTAVIGLGVVGTRAINEQVQVVITDYVEDVKARRYTEAYDSLCSQAKRETSRADFVSRVAAEEPIDDYRVGELDLTSVEMAVPVDVTYRDGDTARLFAYLDQNRQTGEFQVCRIEE
jgi:hypothetical protein